MARKVFNAIVIAAFVIMIYNLVIVLPNALLGG